MTGLGVELVHEVGEVPAGTTRPQGPQNLPRRVPVDEPLVLRNLQLLEVVSTARSVSDLHQISPGYRQVVQSDPVVLRFVFPQVPPGDPRSITYEADTPGSGPAGKRLDRLMADQRKAEVLYDGQHHINQAQLHTLVIAPSAVSLSVGQSTTLTLSGSMDDGTPAAPGVLNATWTSSRPDVASVVSGTVRATASGGLLRR